MAVEKININNQIISPNTLGICDLGNYLTEHQSLDSCLKLDAILVMTEQQYETSKETLRPDQIVFIVEDTI